MINFLFLYAPIMKKKLFILLTVLCFQCKQQDNKQIEQSKPHNHKKSSQLKKKKKKINISKIENDTIDSRNVVEFLTLFGQKNKESLVRFDTQYGNITIKLYEETPLHRASFIFLIKAGYFDQTNFHRVIKNFIVQGGNSDHPLTRKFRIKYRSYRIPAEIKPHRKHKYGALAAARQWENNPNKVSSPFEFYIIQSKEGSHHLDGEHTIFGEVISGMSIVDKIANLETDNNQWPIKDVKIKAKVIE